YIPFATQNANAYSGRFGLPNDLYERFHFGTTKTKYATFDQKRDDFVEGWTPNVYAPCFKESAVDDLASSLKKILSTAMGQEENFLEKLTYRAAPMMKANFYPACKKMSKDQPRLAEHTDVVPMTIMLQDDTKNGLEAQNVHGRWLFVNPPKNALFVMTGDCTEILTNGHYRAAPHKVPYPENVEFSKMECRISLPYFVQMNKNDKLKPLAKFLKINSTEKFKSTTYQDIMHKKMKNLVDTVLMTKINASIKPYKPKTSAKIRIKIRPTNNQRCWAVPRTPALPAMPIA
uniref:Fe2OG dioxygenase domain-containing protein n=1 Tax=Romanomermis culicivorax TaxID=13658 RepID=A0A915JG48_ROMCU